MNSYYDSSRSAKKYYKPFVSIFFIITTLFLLVFLKMEERRRSYAVLKLTRDFKRTTEITKQKEIHLAKLSRPQFVESMAKGQLTLKRATEKQIIHLGPIMAMGTK